MIEMLDVKLLSSRARLFKALSDRTRLEIIDYLKGGERYVCEIIPALGKAQSTTSVSLDQLYRAGILKRRQEGKKTLYSIRSSEIFKLLGEADRLNLMHLADVSDEVAALKRSLAK